MTSWIRRLTRGQQLERQLDAELRDHVERHVADCMRAGMSEAEARRQAMIAIGGLEQVKERCRDVRGTMWLEHVGRDVAYALRQLRRRPAFWSVVVVTLVIGIATSTSMFAIINGVLLRPLPFQEPDRLVSITGAGYRGVYLELRQRSATMDVGASFPRAPMTLTGRGEPVRLDVMLADSHLFDVLEVNPLIGRRFFAEDVRPGAPPVVLLSYGVWQQRFGADHGVVEQHVILDGVAHTVTGVMPADFRFPGDIWLPLVINPANQVDLWANGANMIARLRPGVQLAQAQQEVHALVPPLHERFPWSMSANFGQDATAVPLAEQIIGAVRPTLLVLFASVIAVLLILCVNVANLLLTRGLGRERELAIRAAVGATRARLVWQLILESVTVSSLAGVLGIAASFALLDLIIAFIPADTPRVEDVTIDAWVLAFAFGIALITGLVFGIVPAIRATTAELRSPLGASASSSHVQAAERRASRVLATAEFALAVMLVVSAALLVKSLRNLLNVDPGFRAEQLVTANIAPPLQRYGQPEAHVRFVHELLTRLAAMPGVQSAAAGYVAPFAGRQFGSVFAIEGRPDPATKAGEWAMADVRATISTEYLRVLGVPITEGRAFAESDHADAPPVAIVSRRVARAYWGETPVGKRIRFPGGPRAPWVAIVGVADDIKWNNLGAERNFADGAPTTDFLGTIYLPLAQTSFVDRNGVRLLLRTDAEPERIAASVRAIVQSVDGDTPVSDIRMGDAAVAQSVARPRFTAFLLALFAGVALFLGAIGVYGVLAYAVGRRTQEFAIRLAIGASQQDLLRGVLAEGVRLALAGVALGLSGAFLATRALSTLLFGVKPVDPSVFAGAAVLLVVVGLLASYLPARRAMRVDPVTALQGE